MSILYLSVALLSLAFACLAQLASVRPSPSSLQEIAHLPRFAPPHLLASSSKQTEHVLLDIVLLASVDGKLHALKRSSGQKLWSMSSLSSPIPSNASVPPALVPLVRTDHVAYDPDLTDESDIQETYIIEPQSGAIFVMTNPSSPLRRFPFTMPELVEMSPFSFPGDEGSRIFVGRKETSLLLIELETGKVKATLNSECPWDPIEDMKEDGEVDLDELEGSKPQKPSLTEVFIGRTDYYISIHNKPPKGNPSFPRKPVQNLTYSVYGPNNQDHVLQSSYRRTKDDAYIQSFPTGEIISFVATPDEAISSLMWMQKFTNPIVAILDVLDKRSPAGSHPFVLEQPRPRLQDVAPGVSPENSATVLPNAESAHVGMVTETGSLFAMSPERFPLVAFGNSDVQNNRKLIEGSQPSLPISFDDTVPPRRPSSTFETLNCRQDVIVDRRCLLGMRKVEEGEWPLKRLIEAGHGVPRVEGSVFRGEADRNSGREILDELSQDGPRRDSDVNDKSIWHAMLLAILFGLVSAWVAWKRLRSKMTKGITALDTPTLSIRPDEKEDSQRSTSLIPDSSSASNGWSTDRSKTSVPPLPPISASVLPSSVASLIPTPSTPPLASEPDEDVDESEKEAGVEEGDVPITPGRRKVRRGKRGRKKKAGIVVPSADEGKKSNNGAEAVALVTMKPVEQPVDPLSIVDGPTSTSGIRVGTSLTVSDAILGYGSHGTVVFQGSLQGRAVAVKRLLRDFVTLADREVSILQESDDHPNVIRYYYQEAHASFLYIALELCPASLADVIEYPDRDQWRDVAISFDPKRALKQITSGLKHLHALKLVHRDIKPQNILVSSMKPGSGSKGGYRMLISDFGLCKKLDVDQTSFAPTAYGAMAAGTVGWRAPEILRGEVKLDEINDDNSMSSRGSVATVVGGSASGSGNSHPSGKPRLTKSVDIFALGCLFYYVLTNGGHPYGDKYEREVNILKNAKNLGGLERFGEEGSEAVDLISQMLDPDASKRPNTTTCLLHPYFWDSAKRLNFLQDASDRFEIMCRDPKDPYLLELEKDAASIVGSDWHTRLDKIFIENLGKFRKYDGKSVQDLLRALRNKKHHYQDIPDNVKRHLGPMPEGYLTYFTRRFPHLFLHVHAVVRTKSLQTESMFRSYFELPE
ncbi:hypothetical protein JOM56_004107 [Amanita muscaria]